MAGFLPPRWSARAFAALLLLLLALPAATSRAEKPCPLDAVVRVFTIHGIDKVQVAEDAWPLLVPAIGHGSGSIISDDGLILTARHVVDGASGIAVWLSGSRSPTPAEIVYVDRQLDFALLKIEGRFRKTISVTEIDDDVTHGDDLAAIGYPLDSREPIPSHRKGDVQRVRNSEGIMEVGIPFDRGISGGPVCSDDGIVGVAVAREGFGTNYVVPAGPIRAALVDDVQRTGLLEEADGRMHGERWDAYAAYSVLAARLLVDMPEDMDKLADWLAGNSIAGQKSYYDQFNEIAAMPQSPGAKLVLASFFWNDATLRMWQHDCNSIDCLTDVEDRYLTRAVFLGVDAFNEDQRIRQTGGSGADMLITLGFEMLKETTEFECGDGVDNDGNGIKDCEERSCSRFAICGGPIGGAGGIDDETKENIAIRCADDKDNDGDGRTDCQDPDCGGFIFCQGGGPGGPGGGPEDYDDEGGGRPFAQWDNWENQFVPYGGFLFPTPVGEDTDVDLWGLGFLYQRRAWGVNVARWFHFDLVVGVDGLFHSWGDELHERGGAETKIPEGFAFAFSIQPTLRLVFGTDFGLVVEGYYPFTVLFADPVSVGYKVWGARAGVFFDEAFTIGLMLHQLIPGSEELGVWGLMIMVGF